MNLNDAFARLAALSSAQMGRTAPNPNVSAAIYSADGNFIAEGAHEREVSPDHAEVVALKKAGSASHGATMVVSLEPCNHTGRTGPCVDAIIKAGIAKVIYAVKDANPVAAGGADRLRAAGIEVEFVESPQLEKIQGAWLHRIKTGRPHFIWKIATSLDGRIAALDGTSKWISSVESRADVQIMRMQSDAILIGTGTALADNPTLRPRIDGAHSPIRIVMGNREVPVGYNLHDGIGETIFLQSHDPSDLLRVLESASINQVLVEAGPALGSALIAAGIIDEVLIYQGPIVLGAGRTWLEDIGVRTMAEAHRLTLIEREMIGSDFKVRYRVEKR